MGVAMNYSIQKSMPKKLRLGKEYWGDDRQP